MAAVNQNMFGASIGAEPPGGASLMVLPLNLIAQIVSHVSTDATIPARALSNRTARSKTQATSPSYAEHAASSITWPYHNFTAA
jgi:hypothetical protein